MCIVFSIIERVYWYLRVILLNMFVVKSLYVSFPRSSFLCIHFVIFLWEWDGDLLLRTPGHCHFHHYIHYWCDFHSMFDLSWSPIFFVYSLFCYHPCHCLWFIPFALPPLLFSYTNLFQVWCFPCIILTHLITSLICFIVSLLILYSQVPSGPWLMSFSIHVAFYTWGHGFFYHWVFGSSFP